MSRFLRVIVLLGVLVGGATAAVQDDRPKVELLTDFTDAALNDRWAARNDDVMGGRSEGNLSIDADEGVLTMSGAINLNGGGFTSVMMDVAGAGDIDFTGVRGIRFRVRTDREPSRPYRLRVEDDVARDRGLNFRGLMTLSVAPPADEWQDVTVWLQHLRPTFQGRELDPADWPPLDPSRIRSLGIILNDTAAGPYELQVQRIELIR